MAKPFNELKRKKITVTMTECDEDIYNFFVKTKNSSALVRRLLLTYMLKPVEMEAIMRGETITNIISNTSQIFEKRESNSKEEFKYSNLFEITEEDEKVLQSEDTEYIRE